MPTFNHVSAVVRVDGCPLPEYCTDYDKVNRQVKCWIPSQYGKEFDVKIKTDYEFIVGFKIMMDGVKVKRSSLDPRGGMVVSSFHPTPITQRPFLFSKAELTDRLESDFDPSERNIGEIRVLCTRARILTDAPPNPLPKSFPLVRRLQRGDRAVADCISLGKLTQRQASIKKYTQDLELIVDFVFYYRPLAYLQAEGIAPPAPILEPKLEPGASSDKPRLPPLSSLTSTLIRDPFQGPSYQYQHLYRPASQSSRPPSQSRPLSQSRPPSQSGAYALGKRRRPAFVDIDEDERMSSRPASMSTSFHPIIKTEPMDREREEERLRLEKTLQAANYRMVEEEDDDLNDDHDRMVEDSPQKRFRW